MTDKMSAGLAKFVKKLDRRHPFSDRERDALLDLSTFSRDIAAQQQIVAEDDRRTSCSMIRTGMVSRTRRLFDGEHKIVAFCLPGDLIDLESMLLPMADYGIVTHMPTTTTSVSHNELLAISAAFPNIMKALWMDTLVDGAMHRGRVISNSRRPERARLAHLLLEFDARLDAAGARFELPVTHQILGEAIDLSATHISHAFNSLVDDGFITVDRTWVTIVQREVMQDLSGFDRGARYIDGRLIDGEDETSEVPVPISVGSGSTAAV